MKAPGRRSRSSATTSARPPRPPRRPAGRCLTRSGAPMGRVGGPARDAGRVLAAARRGARPEPTPIRATSRGGPGWPPQTADALARGLLLWEVGGARGRVGESRRTTSSSSSSPPSTGASVDAVAFEDDAVTWAGAATDGQLRVTEIARDAGGLRALAGSRLRAGRRRLRDLRAPARDPTADRAARRTRWRRSTTRIYDRASVTHPAFGNARDIEPYAADYATFRASPSYPTGWDLLVRTRRPAHRPRAARVARRRRAAPGRSSRWRPTPTSSAAGTATP